MSGQGMAGCTAVDAGHFGKDILGLGRSAALDREAAAQTRWAADIVACEYIELAVQMYGRRLVRDDRSPCSPPTEQIAGGQLTRAGSLLPAEARGEALHVLSWRPA